MAGRPPKPSKLHVLHGTRPDRKRENELEIESGPIGDPPNCVAVVPEAMAEWQLVTSDLIYSQILAPVFRSVLIEYCLLHAEMISGEIKSGDRKQLNSLRMQLGLTPASQSKVRVPSKEKAKSKWDKLG